MDFIKLVNLSWYIAEGLTSIELLKIDSLTCKEGELCIPAEEGFSEKLVLFSFDQRRWIDKYVKEIDFETMSAVTGITVMLNIDTSSMMKVSEAWGKLNNTIPVIKNLVAVDITKLSKPLAMCTVQATCYSLLELHAWLYQGLKLSNWLTDEDSEDDYDDLAEEIHEEHYIDGEEDFD